MGAFIYLINTPDAWAPIVCWACPWGPGALGPRALVVVTGPQGPGSNNGAPRPPGLRAPGPHEPQRSRQKMKILENPIFS